MESNGSAGQSHIMDNAGRTATGEGPSGRHPGKGRAIPGAETHHPPNFRAEGGALRGIQPGPCQRCNSDAAPTCPASAPAVGLPAVSVLRWATAAITDSIRPSVRSIWAR